MTDDDNVRPLRYRVPRPSLADRVVFYGFLVVALLLVALWAVCFVVGVVTLVKWVWP